MKGFLIFKNFIFDPLLSILYFPFWWYSKGFSKFFIFFKNTLKEFSNPFVLKILITNLTKPMYGDYSREGRIISFFMRIIHLSWHIFKIVLIFIIFLILLIFYLLLLPFIFYEITCSFKGSCFYFLLPPII